MEALVWGPFEDTYRLLLPLMMMMMMMIMAVLDGLMKMKTMLAAGLRWHELYGLTIID